MDNTFSPKKSISSRYSLKTIPSSRYKTVSISGSTNLPMATLTSAGTYTQGYVYAPYIMAQISTEDYRKWQIKILKEERIKKLNKLNNQKFS